MDLNNGGVFVLPPYVKGKIGEWYRGTANAIYQNIPFIEQYDPEYVLILSGDHIYKMDYNAMLRSHIANQADCTIAVRPVPWADAPSFGIMNTDAEDRIIEFEEKPKKPKSNRASMGVYIFTWSVLRKYLIDDEANPNSHNDFGKNIIPGMLGDGLKLMAYSFEDYWKDVGTIRSLWESNMDLISETPQFNLHDKNWRIYARNPIMPPHYVGPAAQVDGSMVTEGCAVYGCALRSVLFAGVTIERGAVVEDSVIMPGAVIKTGAVVKRSIVGEKTVVCEGCRVGDGGDSEIALVGSGAVLKPGAVVLPGQQSDGREEEA